MAIRVFDGRVSWKVYRNTKDSSVSKVTIISSDYNEAFAAWKNQVVSLATIQHPREESHYGTLLQALFPSVTIHGSNAGEEFSVETKRGSKFDACG
jgi:hypothetical protein